MTYERIVDLLRSGKKGPKPQFTTVHVLRILELAGQGYVGRKMLVRKVGLGEGSIRTIIGKLRDANLIEVKRAGVRLTNEGERFVKSLRDEFSPGVAVPSGSATVDRENVAVAVHGSPGGEVSGIEQRDAAMAVGASGASTFLFRGGNLTFPGMNYDLEEYDPDLHAAVTGSFELEEGDMVVVGSGSDIETAYLGAIAAAVSLLG